MTRLLSDLHGRFTSPRGLSFIALAIGGALGLTLASTSPASAQVVVHDPTGYAQMIRDARTALAQLEALQADLEQARALYESLNTASGLDDVGALLSDPALRRVLPEAEALARAARGDLEALGSLAAQAEALREEWRGDRPPPDPEHGPEHDPELIALDRAGARTARDLVVAQALLEAADARGPGLEALEQAIGRGDSARAVLDVQARIQAEQAHLQNEAVRLQALALARAAEVEAERLARQERAEARRTARLRLYAAALPGD